MRAQVPSAATKRLVATRLVETPAVLAATSPGSHSLLVSTLSGRGPGSPVFALHDGRVDYYA